MSLRALVAAGVIAILFAAAGIALALDLPPGGTFVDDDGNIHEGNIEAIAADGITSGCNPPANDRYCPASSMTRGQMAAFLVRAAGLTAAATDYFDDDDGSTFESDINRLASAGITLGCNPPANDHFCPDGTVTRGQMAAFLVRAFPFVDDGGGDHFTDDDSSVFENEIDRLKTAGVTAGCNPPTNDRFCPKDDVRRDEMASFLARALKLDPIVPPPREVNCPIDADQYASGSCSPLWPASAAGTRNVEEWKSLVSAHWPANRVDCVLGIIKRESNGDPQAVNGSTSVFGLMQHAGRYWNWRAAGADYIDNDITAHIYNAEANIAAGRFLADYQENRGNPWWWDWKAWNGSSYYFPISYGTCNGG